MTATSQNACLAPGAQVSPTVAFPTVPKDAPTTTLQWTVVAEIQDVLALLRTAILLARHCRTSLRLLVALPWPGGQREDSLNSVIHFGDAPCSALILELLDLVDHRLKTLAGGESRRFLVQVEFPCDSQPITVRIGAGKCGGEESR
jgi:hypothetical protein